MIRSYSDSPSDKANVKTTTIGGKQTKIILKDDAISPIKSSSSSSNTMIDSQPNNDHTNKSDSTDNESQSSTNHNDAEKNRQEVSNSVRNHTESTSTSTGKACAVKDKKKKNTAENEDMLWCKAANNEYKKSLEKNLNPISFTRMNKLTSVSNGYHGSDLEKKLGLERVMDPLLYCHHCKQLNENCHFKVYGDYIEKKLLYEYTSKTEYPGDPVIYKECVQAYNEKRRVVFHDKFGFYDRAKIDLPYCLVKHAYDIETMVQNIVKATNINNNIRKGVVQCIRAKRSRQA